MLNGSTKQVLGPILCCLAIACQGAPRGPTTESGTPAAVVEAGLRKDSPKSHSRVFAELDQPPAGVAGGLDVVFVGSPFEGRVLALSRRTGRPVGELPVPANGFVLPYILHEVGVGRVAVLDAGGVPSPSPFVAANPTIYEYSYTFSPRTGFAAELTRAISFESVLVGFPEDFVRLDDGRYLLSDAVLGSLWVAEPNGSIRPGIVPRSFAPQDAIAQLVFCPTMPEIQVSGVPFLFSASTLPGIGPMAVHDGMLYFSSSCAGGTYTVPLATLSDARRPEERAADIRLLSAKPAGVAVEELLGFAFPPASCDESDYLYATDALQHRIIRVDIHTGAREVVADDPALFDFPSSTAFLPPVAGVSPLAVVSNQQERLTFTNDAITQDDPSLPFLVTELFVGRPGPY
ncbi:MAG TPA: hypothetical protein VF331_16820 [Polyangiales bacterium]